MRPSSFWIPAFGAAALAAMLAAPAAQAAFKVIYRAPASAPLSPAIGAVANGVVYGTDPGGGAAGAGVLFALTRKGTRYRYAPLYTFQGQDDGQTPNARLAFDGSGDVLGTAQGAGANGTGTIFAISSGGQLLWSFSPQFAQGSVPWDGLAADGSGNFYGTASRGALGAGNGSLFRVDDSGAFRVVYLFKSKNDGHCPFTGVVIDSAGTIYGTTVGFGFGGQPNGSIWARVSGGRPKTQYAFADTTIAPGTLTDGEWPQVTPSFDAAGNLWGVTFDYNGGVFAGAIWTLTSSGFSPVYNFTGGADGFQPNGPLLLAQNGDLYGTTAGGGSASGTDGFGVVYRIDPQTGAFKVVHTFTGGADGAYPTGSLAIDASGLIYGGTKTGVVYRIKP